MWLVLKNGHMYGHRWTEWLAPSVNLPGTSGPRAPLVFSLCGDRDRGGGRDAHTPCGEGPESHLPPSRLGSQGPATRGHAAAACPHPWVSVSHSRAGLPSRQRSHYARSRDTAQCSSQMEPAAPEVRPPPQYGTAHSRCSLLRPSRRPHCPLYLSFPRT